MIDQNNFTADEFIGPMPIVAEKEPYSFNSTEKIFALITIIISFLYVQFQIFNTTGFITTAVNIAIITLSIIFLKKHKCKFSASNKRLAVILYLFSLVFSVTDNGLIKFLATAFIFVAGAYFVYSVAEGKSEIEKYLPVALLKAVFEFPFSFFGAEFSALKSAMGNSKTSGNIRYIIIGLSITIPFTLVIASLLISADKGMEDFMNNIFNNLITDNIFESIRIFLVSIPCGMYLFAMIYGNCQRSRLNILKADLCEESITDAKSIPNMILYTAVTPILLLYVIFFISQGNYFFSAFSGTLPDGYSYSEYARRGFFELCAVTVINLFIIIFISFLSKESGRFKPKTLKFYTLSVSGSTILLIVVAISKMVMYITEYGLTRLRFYTMWFMLLCVMIFILIIVKQFRFDMKFSSWISGIFTVMLAILCFCSPDYVIAKYNIEMYKSGYLNELDENTILSMSYDGMLCAINSGEIDTDKIEEFAERRMEKQTVRYPNIPSLIVHSELGD